MVSKRPQRTVAELAERYRLKVEVYKRDRGLCFYCDEPRSFKDMTMDHIEPECYGGRLEYDNIVCACFECNHERGNMPADVYLRHKKRPATNYQCGAFGRAGLETTQSCVVNDHTLGVNIAVQQR